MLYGDLGVIVYEEGSERRRGHPLIDGGPVTLLEFLGKESLLQKEETWRSLYEKHGAFYKIRKSFLLRKVNVGHKQAGGGAGGGGEDDHKTLRR